MIARRIEKLLIANRGEIALRVMRSCRAMGIRTVAVYSDADQAMPFVAAADEAVSLGGAPPRESYLNIDKLLEAARRTGADAIHPGYGFLSENAEFARRVADAALTFVGPPASAIEAMGSKIGARALMQKAGVPVVPGAELAGASEAEIASRAASIGFPVLVKASFGGGGRGMRIVESASALLSAVDSARREAASAFGNDTVFLERYISSPRHIELQIFGDTHGNAVHLFERECSIQRRHQKIIEEAPSPAVTDVLRTKMGAAAVTAAKAIGYVGAGTVEFILAPEGDFFFLEVNTRLQVEHPVTEMITGLDLVRLQLLVAQGEPLPPEALRPTRRGHAIEARLYAEDPRADYLPVAGRLHRFDLPADVRVDAGYESANSVSIHYDSMLAKVIAYAPTRAEAAQHLASALRRSRIHGLVTNRDLLVATLEHPTFRAGQTDTHFLQRHPPQALLEGTEPEATIRLHAVAAALAGQARRRAEAKVLSFSPSGFRNNPSQPQRQSYQHRRRTLEVSYTLGRALSVQVDDTPVPELILHSATLDRVEFTASGVRRRFAVDSAGAEVFVDSPLGSSTFVEVDPFPLASAQLASGSLVAPMPGKVVRVNVAVGDAVQSGAVLLVMEAMKMEHAVAAISAGKVSSLNVKQGDTVAGGDLLVVVEVAEQETAHG